MMRAHAQRSHELMQQQARTPAQTNHMESSVTRLLVATKMLLESLTQWALRKDTETNVSRIYVRLGNDFNASITAFMSAGIDMRCVDGPLLFFSHLLSSLTYTRK